MKFSKKHCKNSGSQLHQLHILCSKTTTSKNYFFDPGPQGGQWATSPFFDILCKHKQSKSHKHKTNTQKKTATRKTKTPKKGRVRWGGAKGENLVKKRGFERLNKQETKKMKIFDENNLSDVVLFWCCSLYMKQKQRNTPRKKKTKTRREKARKQGRKKARQQQEREREREREKEREKERERERVCVCENGEWDKLGRNKGTLKNEQKYPLVQGENSLFPNHKRTPKKKKTKQNKNKEGFRAKWGGPKFYIAIVCFPLLVVFSHYVLSFSWLYVSFSSPFFVTFSSSVSCSSSMLSTSHVLTCLLHLCPTFSLFFIFFLLPLLFLPLPLYPVVCVLLQHDTPKKDTKTWFCLNWKTRAGLSDFHKNDILWENIALCCRAQTQFLKIQFSRFQKHNYVNTVT